jgi:hypothetical protein
MACLFSQGTRLRCAAIQRVTRGGQPWNTWARLSNADAGKDHHCVTGLRLTFPPGAMSECGPRFSFWLRSFQRSTDRRLGITVAQRPRTTRRRRHRVAASRADDGIRMSKFPISPFEPTTPDRTPNFLFADQPPRGRPVGRFRSGRFGRKATQEGKRWESVPGMSPGTRALWRILVQP